MVLGHSWMTDDHPGKPWCDRSVKVERRFRCIDCKITFYEDEWDNDGDYEDEWDDNTRDEVDEYESPDYYDDPY